MGTNGTPARPLPYRRIGTASELTSTKPTHSTPLRCTIAAARRARSISCAYVRPLRREPNATRSPKPSTAISRRVDTCIDGSRCSLVGRRERLGVLDQERVVADGERAVAGLRAEDFQAGLRIGVALAEQRPGRVRGIRRAGDRNVVVERDHLTAATAQVDVAGWRPHHYHLGGRGRALQPGSGLQLHRDPSARSLHRSTYVTSSTGRRGAG